MNYKKLLSNVATSQGYCLGLETHHRLQLNNKRAEHFSRLAVGFSRLLLKIKQRARRNVALSMSEYHEIEHSGLKQGIKQASEHVSVK
jgi:hypothetical protein